MHKKERLEFLRSYPGCFPRDGEGNEKVFSKMGNLRMAHFETLERLTSGSLSRAASIDPEAYALSCGAGASD